MRRVMSLLLVLAFVGFPAQWFARADIMPSIYASSIDKSTGITPIEVSISITTDSITRAMKVSDGIRYELAGSINSSVDANNRKTFTLVATVNAPFQGELFVYIKTGGNEWLKTEISFEVNFSDATIMDSQQTSILPSDDSSNAQCVPQQSTSLCIGNIIEFGHYEQDNSISNGKEPVEWIILDIDSSKDRVLLLSNYILDMQRYNKKWSKVSWAKCSVRSWLNRSFYSDSFSETEQNAIVKTDLHSKYVDDYVTTSDYVFLLSVDEATNYLDNNQRRQAKPTEYAISREAVKIGEYSYWWLRETTNRKNDANRINPNGDFEEYGANTNAYGVGIRPAIWVDMSYILTQ